MHIYATSILHTVYTIIHVCTSFYVRLSYWTKDEELKKCSFKRIVFINVLLIAAFHCIIVTKSYVFLLLVLVTSDPFL